MLANSCERRRAIRRRVWYKQEMVLGDENAIAVRRATPDDVPALTELISASVRQLQAEDYSSGQREGALGRVFGVDPVLIEDGTYFVVVEGSQIWACGGWSRRATPFGTDSSPARDDSVLDPLRDAARIRALFVHPSRARTGLGTLLLRTCEAAAKEAGFSRSELTATLTGVKLFRARGYVSVEQIRVPLANGAILPVVRMEKLLSGESAP